MKNEQFCADKGSQGATCAWTNGGPTTHLTVAEWDRERFGKACTDIDAITRMVGVIRKLCFDTGRCTYEEYTDFKKRVQALYKKVGFERQAYELELELE